MAIEKPAPWTGASGIDYVFYVFGLEPEVPDRLGLYIYAKRNAEGAWAPVYMGHGDLSRCCADPALQRCIASKAATHLHLRLNSLEADRDAELDDLLARYANVFAPEGCQPGAASTRPRTAVDPAISTATKAASTRKAPAKKTPAKKAPDRKAATRKTPVKARQKRPRPPSK